MHRLLHANSCKSREYESNYHPAPATLFIVIWTASKREFTHTYAYYPRNLWKRPPNYASQFYHSPDCTRCPQPLKLLNYLSAGCGKTRNFLPWMEENSPVKLLEFQPEWKTYSPNCYLILSVFLNNRILWDFYLLRECNIILCYYIIVRYMYRYIDSMSYLYNISCINYNN